MIAILKSTKWPRFGAARPATSLIGMDLGADTIRAVQLLRTTNPPGAGLQYQIRSRVHTRRSAEQDAPSGGAIGIDDNTVNDMARLFQRGAFRGRDVVLGMDPPDLSTVALNLPLEGDDLDHPKLLQALAFELGRHLGYDPDQAEMRAWRLPPGGPATPTLMGAAARRTLITASIDAVERAGFRCCRIDAGACALVRCCTALADPPQDAIWGVMDIGRMTTRLVVAVKGIPILQREIAASGGMLTFHIARRLNLSTEAAEQLKRDHGVIGADPAPTPSTADDPAQSAARVARMILSAVRRSMRALAVEAEKSMAYAMHMYPDLPVSRLYLAGGGAALKGLPELLATEIGIEVKRIDPLAVLDPNRPAAAPECGPAWTKAVGLALLNRK